MGKKLGTILFDSVTDLETSQESFLAYVLSLSTKKR